MPNDNESLESVLQESLEWAEETFPNIAHYDVLTHMTTEIAELLIQPFDPQEYADVLMLLNHAAAIAEVDLTKAVRDKLEINKTRTWNTDAAYSD